MYHTFPFELCIKMRELSLKDIFPLSFFSANMSAGHSTIGISDKSQQTEKE